LRPKTGGYLISHYTNVTPLILAKKTKDSWVFEYIGQRNYNTEENTAMVEYLESVGAVTMETIIDQERALKRQQLMEKASRKRQRKTGA